MIVVADTSPLNYLVLIRKIELLPRLYGRVLIPFAVQREMRQEGSPPLVQSWTSCLPVWCEVRDPSSVPDPSLSELDAGERDAIQLALDEGVDTVLMDEIHGRREALRRDLRVTGTLAVLEKAAQRGLIDFQSALRDLESTNFRLSTRLRDEFVRRNP
jgi:predicted nucleic acid-binding protein